MGSRHLVSAAFHHMSTTASQSSVKKVETPPPSPSSVNVQSGVHAPANQAPPYNATEEAAIYEEFAELSRHTVKRSIVLFFGRGAFSDNTKYLFLATVKAMPDHEVVWCTWSKPLQAQLTARGFKAIDLAANPQRSFNLFLYAAVAVFCENPATALSLNSTLSGSLAGAKKIQLWHGVSVKHLDLMLIEH